MASSPKWHFDPDRPWLYPPFQSVGETETEVVFRRRVAAILRAFDWRVYCHDPGSGPQFSVHYPAGYTGVRGFVDLYCVVPGYLDWQEKFPYIAIELKLAKNLKWLRASGEQVGRYLRQLNAATYSINGEMVPPPDAFLIATQDAWNDGILYRWRHPKLATWSTERTEGFYLGFTEAWNRFLIPQATLLLGGPEGLHFTTNLNGSHGALTRYDITR